VLFCDAIFAGGCAYWIALVLFLDHWRAGLTRSRMVWLNRANSMLMLVAAAGTIASLARALIG
jgi:hypothetical protein